jgi:hypothetical protein
MKRQAASVFWVLVAGVSLWAAGPASADAFSFGLGVSNGQGGFFSLGVSNMGGRHSGGGHYRHGYRGHCAPPPVVCAPVPVVCAPRPVVCVPPPVVDAPAPVVYAPAVQTVVVNSGYWVEREQRVWVEGVWIESVDAFGRACKTWQPGRWEIRRTREWVAQQ